MKRALVVILAAALAAVATTTAAAARVPYAAHASASCAAPKIGYMGPTTGPVAFIGTEQFNWIKFAVSEYNRRNGTHFSTIAGDTMFDPAQDSIISQQFASNPSILGVVGPAGSQEVIAASPAFTKAHMAFISGSASRTTLTDGSIPTFSRVVPNDSVQAPTTARFISKTLKAKKVFVIDDQSSYSVPLADGAQANLKAAGVAVQRESVSQQASDFSALVSKVSSDTDVVYLPWQVAKNATLFVQQMKEQGKNAKIVGSDGLFAPGEFLVEGAYVFAFAPDIRGIKADAGIVKAYNAKYGTKWGTFGPATYLAAQLLLVAIKQACLDGNATRAEVAADVRKVNVTPSILGGTFRLNAKGDPNGASWYLFQIKGGNYNSISL